MSQITELTGDATRPNGPGFLVHVCNNQGLWGGGFTGALSRRWHQPEMIYRMEAANRHLDGLPRQDWLGSIQQVSLPAPDDHLTVINMIAQDGVVGAFNPKPIRFDALTTCLIATLDLLLGSGLTTLHMPRIGSGLAGGDWDDEVRPLLEGCLLAYPDARAVVYVL